MVRKGLFRLCIIDLNENNYPSTNIQMDVFKKHIYSIQDSGHKFLNPNIFNQIFFSEKLEKKFLLTIDDGYLVIL